MASLESAHHELLGVNQQLKEKNDRLAGTSKPANNSLYALCDPLSHGVMLSAVIEADLIEREAGVNYAEESLREREKKVPFRAFRAPLGSVTVTSVANVWSSLSAFRWKMRSEH